MSMRLIQYIVLLALYNVAHCAMYLPSGVPYTATVKSGQSILFYYNLTIGCRDLKIFSTGDNDLYISQTDPNPGVYGYSMMSDACGGDQVYIKHTADKHPEGIYWISAYLDPIIYDKPTNFTIELLELISANTLLPNGSLSYSNTDTSPHPICINEYALQIQIDITASASFGVFLAKHDHIVTTWSDNTQQKLIFSSGNATDASFIVAPALYPGFNEGNWYISVFPDCGCNCTAPLDYSLTVRPYTNSISSNTPTDTITALTNGVAKSASLANPTYYSFDVGYCDDVTFTLANTTKAEIFVAYTQYPTSNDFAWRATCSEQISISHEDPSYLNGTMYITVKCIENEDCAAENVVIRAYKEIGPRTITPTSFFNASGHVNPDTINWYSICVPDWETGINITTITISTSENVDVFVSRVPYFEKNYTQYVADGIPNWNLWQNWQYEFRPFPRCPYSMLMNANVTTGSFSPGMFYVALYSFCLASCDYCHSAIDYEVQITQSDKDLSRCRAVNETTTTATTTASPEVSSAVRADNFVYVAYLIFIVLPYVLF